MLLEQLNAMARCKSFNLFWKKSSFSCFQLAKKKRRHMERRWWGSNKCYSFLNMTQGGWYNCRHFSYINNWFRGRMPRTRLLADSPVHRHNNKHKKGVLLWWIHVAKTQICFTSLFVNPNRLHDRSVRAQSSKHHIISPFPHHPTIPFIASACVCVCVCLCVSTISHKALLFDGCLIIKHPSNHFHS